MVKLALVRESEGMREERGRRGGPKKGYSAALVSDRLSLLASEAHDSERRRMDSWMDAMCGWSLPDKSEVSCRGEERTREEEEEEEKKRNGKERGREGSQSRPKTKASAWF